jgi:serine/threonine-protein kinase RsbW
LAFVEACNNAIQYAPPTAKQTPVSIQVLCSAEDILFRIMDHTLGFELPARIDPPGLNNERGRGLFIIRSVMNEITYDRRPEGNVLTLRKKRKGRS